MNNMETMLSDNSTVESDQHGEKPFGWGPSHSYDETEFTDTTGRFFGGKDSRFDHAWTLIEDGCNVFRCGNVQAVATQDTMDRYTFDEDEPYVSGAGCSPTGLCQTSNRAKRNGGGNSVITEAQGTVVTLNDMSLNSILGTQPAQRAWSSPPRLHNLATAAKVQRQASGNQQQTMIPKILDDAFHFSDMDTFLSDEFTDMEQGIFNGLYDRICSGPRRSTKQHNKRREPSSMVMCGALPNISEPKSVLLSFDDTISKLTVEDQKSCSTETLNTMDQRATIAAIVRAQARGGWRAMAQEEAEAKADELSRFGIEYTFTESQLSPPNVPAENMALLEDDMILPEPEHPDDEPPQFENIQPNFFSSESSTQATQTDSQTDSQDEGRESTEDAKADDSGSKITTRVKNRFLLPFHRKKKKDRQSKGSKQKRPSFLKALTPPRKLKQVQAPGSPTSTTAPSSETTYSHGEKVLDEPHPDRDSSTSAGIRDAPKESTSVFEEVEILTKRKEPVYSSYMRTPSYNIVEDVEILRKESDVSHLSHLKLQFSTGHCHTGMIHHQDALEAVHEEAGTGETDPAESTSRSSTRMGSEKGSSSLADTLFDEEGDEVDDERIECSSVDTSLMSMTSRLAKFQEESQQLRLMLEKKDEDFEQLREMLQSNESKAVMDRFNSSSNYAKQLVQ